MTDRYVSPTGVNSGTGTTGSPWQTLAYALTHAAASDRLLLRSGTYGPTGWIGGGNAAAAGITIEPDTGAVVVLSSGSANITQLENWKNVVINGNANGGSIEVRGTWGNDVNGHPIPGKFNGIYIYYSAGQPGFVPDGCNVNHLKVHGIAGWGIHIGHTASDSTNTGTGPSNNVVEYNEVWDVGTGIRFNHPGLGNEARFNYIHDTARMIVNTAAADNADNGGVAIAVDNAQATGASKTSPSVRVHDNVLVRCHAFSYDYGEDGGAVELYQSQFAVIEDNYCESNNGTVETGTSDPTGMPCKNNVIQYNTIKGRCGWSGGDDVFLIRASEATDYFHNTIDVSLGIEAFRIKQNGGPYGGVLTNLRIKNNIIHLRDTTKAMTFDVASFSASGIEIDYNLIHTDAGNTAAVVTRTGATYNQTQLAAFQAATPYGDHDVWGLPPLWVAPDATSPLDVWGVAEGDYTLGALSPAIDRGVVIAGTNDGYSGSAPDIGRYEYVPLTNPLLAQDTFTRSVTGGLGTPDLGGAYTLIGTAANMTVDGSKAVFAHSVANAPLGGVLQNNVLNVTATCRVMVGTLPSGSSATFQLIARWFDSSNYIRVPLKVFVNKVSLAIEEVVAGSPTVVVADTTTGLTQAGGTWYRVRAQVTSQDGTDVVIRARAWLDGNTEPTTWLVQYRSTTATLLGPGAFGYRTVLGTGITGGPYSLNVDDFAADDIVIPVALFDAVHAGIGTHTATMTTGILLAGTSDGVGDSTADLATEIVLAGTSDGVSTTLGILSAGALTQLAGTDAGVSNTFGTLAQVGVSGLPIEVIVASGAAPTVMLDVLDGARQARWFDPLNDIGSGSFVISTSDPKATPNNLAQGNIVTFLLNGVARYAIVIEAPELATGSIDGIAADHWEIKGRGLEAVLAKARQAPGTATNYGTVPAAAVLVSAITAAKAAGRLALPAALAIDFTATTDSAGKPWQDSAPYTVAAGTDYTAILAMLTAVGIEAGVGPDLHLRAYRDGMGTDRTLTVVFREGRHIRDQLRVARQGAQQVTRVWVEGANGSVVQVIGNETDPSIGVREGYVNVSETDEPATLASIGQTTIDASTAAANALQVPLLHGRDEGSFEPYVDYSKGDRVLINVPGWIDNQTVRIAAITVAAVEAGYEVDVDLNAVVYENIVRLRRALGQALGRI